MPDPFDEFFEDKKKEDTSSKGVIGRFKDLYDSFDQSWLPENDFSKEQYVEENYGLPGRMLGGLNRGLKGVTRGINDALIGSPVRALGTAGTIASGGATKLPSIVRGGIAAMDAVDAARSGIRGYEEAQQGNYGMAAGNVLGAGMQAASTMIPLGRKVTKGIRSYGEPVVTPAKIVPPKVVGVNELNVTSRLPEALPPAEVQQPLLGQRGGPAMFDRKVLRAQPKGLLEEKNTLVTKGQTIPNETQDLTIGAGDFKSRVPYSKDMLAERATREFDALGLPVNDKNVRRYISDPEFRGKIQLNAEKIGASQRYESTLGSKYVQEAQPPKMTTPEVSVDDIRQELSKRGVRATDQFIAKIRKDPELQSRMGMREMFMEGAVMPENQVKGLLTMGESHMIPKDVEEVLGGKQGSLFDAADDDVIKVSKIADSPTANPDVKNIASQAKANMEKSGWFTRFKDSLDTSMERNLEKMGPVGTEIARQVKIASTDKPIRFNSYIKDVRKDIEAVDDKTWESIVDHLDKNTPLKGDARVLADKVRTILDKTGADQVEAGLLDKGAVQTYWPHRYPKDETLVQRLKESGMDEDQVKNAMQAIKDRREMKISGEFSRNDLNVPGYRKDKDVFIDHLREVSNRVEDATRFGAKDINDPTSTISKLIAQSEDPERARELMTRILRGDATSTETQKKVAGAVRKWATASQLSLASISNFGGMLPVAVRSTTSDAISGIGKAFATELPDMKFMENTNLFRKFSGGFAETLNDNNKMYRAFGIEQSQNWLNRYAGAVGHSYAETLFEGLKRNPSDPKALAQLEDLVLDKGSEVLKQTSLTDKQLERAMVRMAEVSQGVTENRKFPYFWNKEGLATIPQIFMRTSFQTSKAMKDAIKLDPVRAIPKLIGGGLLIGEVIGDTKELAKTAAQVGMNSLQQKLGITDEDKNLGDEYKKSIGLTKDDDANDRFSFTRRYLAELDKGIKETTGTESKLAENDLVVRGMGNLEQAFALGMPADILRSLTDALDETGGDAHPVDKAMKFFWAWEEANQVAKTGINAGIGTFNALTGSADKANSRYRDVGREVLKRTPYVGRGAAREVQSAAQQRRDRGSSGGVTFK